MNELPNTAPDGPLNAALREATLMDAKGLRRNSMRLKDYDYSQPGVYFITICTADRKCMLGQVSDGQTVPNEYGRIVTECWGQLQARFRGTSVDCFIAMPNHVHGLIAITEDAGAIHEGNYILA